MEGVFFFFCSNTYRSHCVSLIVEGMRPSPSSDANSLGWILPFTVWTTSFSLKAAQEPRWVQGDWLTPRNGIQWLRLWNAAQAEKRNSPHGPSPPVSCSSYLWLKGCRQICPMQVFHQHCCLESVNISPKKWRQNLPSSLPGASGRTLCFPLLSSRFSIKGRKEDPLKLPFHIMFSKSAWGRKIRTGHTKSHLDLNPFWVFKAFSKS